MHIIGAMLQSETLNELGAILNSVTALQVTKNTPENVSIFWKVSSRIDQVQKRFAMKRWACASVFQMCFCVE